MLLIALSTLAMAGDPVCPSGENMVFGCSLKDGRELSICATPELSPTEGRLQVHLTGKNDALVFPSAPVAQPFAYDRYTRPQTTYLSLAFEHDGARYTVSDDEDNGEIWRGLVVVKDDKEERIDCKKSGVQGSLFKLEGRMPEPAPQ